MNLNHRIFSTRVKIFLPVFIILIIFSFVISKVDASTGLTIQPIKVSKTLQPGQSVSGFIKLSNASSEDVSVELSVEDFIPTAGTSNISFVGRAEGNTTVKDWIKIDVPSPFIFKKEETRDIPYTITAPANAEPGGHFGVLFFKANPVTDSGQLKVGTRVGVLTFVTIPGSSLQKGKILAFRAPPFVQGKSVTFGIDFENTGTVHFEPKGTIFIKNIFGKEVGKVEVSGQTVLPTGRREIQAGWTSENLLVGKYSATAVLFDGEGNELTTKGLSFYAFPIKYVAIFLGAVIVLFLILRYIKKKVNISITVSK